MARPLVIRAMHLLGGSLALLLALSLPAPWKATPAQLGLQILLGAIAVLCVLPYLLERRRPALGRTLTLSLGAGGLLIVYRSVEALIAALRSGATPLAWSTLIPATCGAALVVAGLCGLGLKAAERRRDGEADETFEVPPEPRL